MIVPRFRIAGEVIHHNAAVAEAARRVIRHRIPEAGCLSAVAVCIREEIIVFPADLFHGAALMELVLPNAQRLGHRFRVNLCEIVLQAGCAHAVHLAPVEVRASVVIQKDRGINAVDMRDGPDIPERAARRGGDRYAAAPVRHAVVQVVCPIPVRAVRRIQRAEILCPGCVLQGERDAVIHPVRQVVRRKDMVAVRAVLHSSGQIQRTVQIHPAVGPHMGLHVRHKKPAAQNRVRRGRSADLIHMFPLPFWVCAGIPDP